MYSVGGSAAIGGGGNGPGSVHAMLGRPDQQLEKKAYMTAGSGGGAWSSPQAALTAAWQAAGISGGGGMSGGGGNGVGGGMAVGTVDPHYPHLGGWEFQSPHAGSGGAGGALLG